MRLFNGINGFFGGGVPPAYQTPQHIKDFMQPISVPEVQAVAHYQHLIDDKQGYQDADRAVKLAQQYLQTPDLSEGMKKKFQSDMDLYTKRRDAYAQDAEATRNSAAAIGLDVSDYGTDKTLNEANQAFLNHKNVAVQNFLNNMPSLGELEENRYRELRAQDVSPRTAENIVARERGKMQSQLARRMGDFMTAYGKNPDGSIDQDLGILAMTRVLPDPQSVAQLFASGFAMPNKVYDTNQSLAQAMALEDVRNRGAMDRTQWSGNNQLLMSREGNAAQDKRLATTIEARKQESELDRLHAERMKAAELAVGLIKGTGKGNGNTLSNEIYELAQQMGYKDDLQEEEKQKIWGEAATIVLEKKYGIGNKKLKDLSDLSEALDVAGIKGNDKAKILMKQLGWEEEEVDSELKKAGKFFKNTFDDIQKAALIGDKKTALEKLDEIKETLASKEYRELLDTDAYTLATRKADMYTKLLNGDYESNEGKTNYIKDRFLIEYGREPSVDEIESILMNENFFGVPVRPRTKTPPVKFEVAPPVPGVVPTNPGWNSNAYGINPYGGYGQAYTPR